MPLTRKQKEARIAELATELQGATASVFMAYDKLTVSQVEELRDSLHETKSRVRVMPKRLLARTLDQLKIEFDPTLHEGQCAVAWGSDAIAPAQIIYKLSQKQKEIRILAGTLEGELLSADRVQALAKLPGLQAMRGQVVRVLAAPAQGFVSVLQGSARGLVQVLQAYAEVKSNA